MKLRTMSPPWFSDDPRKEAKCIKFKPTPVSDPWFGESDDPEAIDETEDAKNICLGTYDGRPCPLLEACLEFAVVNNERWGVWGGMSPEERVKLRKERRTWQRSAQDGAQSSQEI